MKNNKVTVLFPGGFKPMHAGHLNIIRDYLAHPDVDKIRLFVGQKTRDGLTTTDGIRIAKILLNNLHDRVSIEECKWPTPVLTAYKVVENAESGRYTLASSFKGTDGERTLEFIQKHQPGEKYHDRLNPGVSVVTLPVDAQIPLLYKGRDDEHDGEYISSTVLRQDILNGDYVRFKTNYPGVDHIKVLKILHILQHRVS